MITITEADRTDPTHRQKVLEMYDCNHRGRAIFLNVCSVCDMPVEICDNYAVCNNCASRSTEWTVIKACALCWPTQPINLVTIL